MVVEECEYYGEHEGDVGEEVLPPRLGDVKSDHGYHVHIIDKDKKNCPFQSWREIFIIISGSHYQLG